MLNKNDLDEMKRNRQVAVQVTTGQTCMSYGTWKHVMAGVLLDELRLIQEVERLAGLVDSYAKTTMPFEQFVRMTLGDEAYDTLIGDDQDAVGRT